MIAWKDFWEEYVDREKGLSKVELAVIKMVFEMCVEGNSSLQEKSSAELQDALFMFRSGWISASMAYSPKVRNDL